MDRIEIVNKYCGGGTLPKVITEPSPIILMRTLFICIFLFILSGCMNTLDDGFLCRFLYFPTETTDNSFWVEVKEDRTMKVVFGCMSWDSHKAVIHGKFPNEGITWEKIHTVDSIVVDSLAYRQLEELASEVKKRESVNNFIVSISYDGMGTILFIKDKYYYIELGDYKDKPTKDLIRKLKEISPIPIRES